MDARAIANLVLDEGWQRNLEITNLKIQKLLFLCHALLLVERGRTVLNDEFVAWKYGPVHLGVYEAFKEFGRAPITKHARKFNPLIGCYADIAPITDQEIRDVVSKVVAFYGPWSAAQLVELTHAEDGPWDAVVKSASNNANVGMRISNSVIGARFKYLWFGARRKLKEQEPYDEEPLVA